MIMGQALSIHRPEVDMTNQHDTTRVIRIPATTKIKLQEIAQQERRTMSAQFDLILEEWLATRQQQDDEQ